MALPGWQDRLIARCEARPPDEIIGGLEDPYMFRWWVLHHGIAVYVHCFLRSDDDRALHDHPSFNITYLLRGCYLEHTIAQGGINHAELYADPSYCEGLLPRVRVRRATLAHRIELVDGPVWSLWLRGPKYRAWGFHCPHKGWVHWHAFDEHGLGCD